VTTPQSSKGDSPHSTGLVESRAGLTAAILTFSRSQKPWVQDALRRIACKSSLEDNDYQDLLAMLYVEHGILLADPAPAPVALADRHLALPVLSVEPVLLNGLSGAKSVNRLAEGQSLRIALDGITVVYGDNGSGKSGYGRLLKKLCRVRDGAEEAILSNVFESRPPAPAEVQVIFTVGSGPKTTVLWSDGDPPPPPLHQISVFDSKAAALYADKDNRVEFLPYGLDLLPRLGALCEALAQKVDAEIGSLERRCRTPIAGFSRSTECGRVVSGLVSEPMPSVLVSEQDLRSFGEWDEARSETLERLEQQLARDPSALASLCDRAADVAIQVIGSIAQAKERLGDDALGGLTSTVETARTARAAAGLAAAEAFGGEPLTGVGGSAWRLMFDYARQYHEVAYPGVLFPAAEPGRRCLLCQQELGDEASRRMLRFADFVQGVAESYARDCELKVADARAALDAERPGPPSEVTSMLGGFEGADEALRKDAEVFLAEVRGRWQVAVKLVSGRAERCEAGPLPADPSVRLSAIAETYRRRATHLRASATDAGARAKSVLEREQLIDRRVLSESMAVVLARRGDLDRLQRLRRCRTGCDTTAISRKGTELRRQGITKEFGDRLRAELDFFRLEYLPLKIGDRSEKGVSYVGPALSASRPVRIETILSEGERKALALACFFAEVGGVPGHSGLIFDDPVSSLDHRHRSQVARRIVAEARKRRQVVLFTHDLTFLHELKRIAAEGTPPVPLVTHEIRRTGERGFGTIFEGAEMWILRKVKERVPVLESILRNAEATTDRSGEAYRRAVKEFYGHLRETWERIVEEILLNGVVSRFDEAVKTQSLKGVFCGDSDYKRVFFGVKKASDWAHDRAAALQNTVPGPDEMDRDLEDLRSFAEHARDQRKATDERRKSLESPPPGTLG
jgi:ABC-type transport system involved in cytochrome c biogenesis ATPase subunit